LKPILEVKNLCKIYDNGVRALNDISISVQPGEFLGIIGLSGSGKSTLLRCINRLVEPTSGSIRFDGEDITKLSYGDLRSKRRKIGMIFQQFNLIKRHSVLKNVLSGTLGGKSTTSSLIGLYTPEEREKALQYLEMVGLPDKARKRADELSGGQQQRVAIARALMQDPQVILADEPVASLDPSTSHSVMQYLELVNKEMGKTVLCNLHFLSLVRQYTTRVIALKGGSIVFEGRPEEINEDWFKRIYGEEAAAVEIH
jgi:phosphonate transport system ATP-binding protein